jgi:hypothetical protein
MTNLEEENRILKERVKEISLLKEKIKQLIADNLEISSRLDNDYDPNKPVRPLTLQEKLELNMGNTLKKYRIAAKDIKKLYYMIMSSDPEIEYFDLTFDKNRICDAFYQVDLDKEKEDIEKGESLEVDPDKIPDDMPELQQKLDVEKVLNKLTDIET